MYGRVPRGHGMDDPIAIQTPVNVVIFVNREIAMPSEPGIRVLNDPEVLRLIADPLRLRILELLRQEPRTVTELAGLLDVARTRLYYHVRLLESHDLVAVAETNVVAGITEKRYRVTAYRLTVDRTLFGGAAAGGDPLDVLLSVILDEVGSEIRRAVASGLIDIEGGGDTGITPRRLLLGRSWFRLSDAEVAELDRRYRDIWTPFLDREVDLSARSAIADPVSDQADPDPGDRRLYEWLIGFYPVVEPNGDPETEG